MRIHESVRVLALVALGLTGLVACAHIGGASSVGQVAPAHAESSVTHPDVDFDVNCRECHAETTPDVYARWHEGRHGQVNVSCFACHGDGIEKFRLVAAPETCRGCHDAQYQSFVESDHESCFTCHDGHTLTFHSAYAEGE